MRGRRAAPSRLRAVLCTGVKYIIPFDNDTEDEIAPERPLPPLTLLVAPVVIGVCLWAVLLFI